MYTGETTKKLISQRPKISLLGYTTNTNMTVTSCANALNKENITLKLTREYFIGIFQVVTSYVLFKILYDQSSAGSRKFLIEPETGLISTQGELDRETTSNYTVSTTDKMVLYIHLFMGQSVERPTGAAQVMGSNMYCNERVLFMYFLFFCICREQINK